MMKNILFVCKHNRFRSKYAETIFKKSNKNKKYTAKSAGLIKGAYPLDKTEVLAGKSIGIQIKGKPQGLNTQLLKWADTIVVVADDVPPSIFNAKKYGKRLIIWRIPDVQNGNKKDIKKIISSIEAKVRNLIRHLK